MLKIEKFLHVVLTRPLAWLIYFCWLGMVAIASATLWARNRLRRATKALAGGDAGSDLPRQAGFFTYRSRSLGRGTSEQARHKLCSPLE